MDILKEYIPMFIVEEIERLTKTTNEINDNICDAMIEYIEAHKNYHWFYGGIVRNPNVTLEYIIAHPKHVLTHIKNNCSYCSPENIDMCEIMSHVETHHHIQWDWYLISQNIFTKEKKDAIKNSNKILLN